MTDTVFLKLGGSLITDKSGDRVFHGDVVRAIGEEIGSAMRERPMRLLLGHGAGCFGHVVADRYRVREGLAGGGGWPAYAATRRGVMQLNGLVLEALNDAGLQPVAVQPSASAMARGGELASMEFGVIRQLLQQGQIPMVFGDAVLDEERGFTIASTEAIFAYLAPQLSPRRIILACDVDGVFDRDPHTHDDATRIGTVDSTNLAKVLETLGQGSGADVTGGMAGKVRAAHDLAWQCFETEIRIVSGLVADRVREALLGRGGGTRIRA